MKKTLLFTGAILCATVIKALPPFDIEKLDGSRFFRTHLTALKDTSIDPSDAGDPKKKPVPNPVPQNVLDFYKSWRPLQLVFHKAIEKMRDHRANSQNTHAFASLIRTTLNVSMVLEEKYLKLKNDYSPKFVHAEIKAFAADMRRKDKTPGDLYPTLEKFIDRYGLNYFAEGKGFEPENHVDLRILLSKCFSLTIKLQEATTKNTAPQDKADKPEGASAEDRASPEKDYSIDAMALLARAYDENLSDGGFCKAGHGARLANFYLSALQNYVLSFDYTHLAEKDLKSTDEAFELSGLKIS